MVIQLTLAELSILEEAGRGRRLSARVSASPDLRLLIDMQLVVVVGRQLEITLIGQHVLKHARTDPHRG